MINTYVIYRNGLRNTRNAKFFLVLRLVEKFFERRFSSNQMHRVNLPRQVHAALRDSFDILLRATSQQVTRSAGPEKREKGATRARFLDSRSRSYMQQKLAYRFFRAFND